MVAQRLMSTQIYLGTPPEHIRQWIIEYAFNKTKIDQLVRLLETGLYNDSNPVVFDGVPLTVGGSEATFKYHVDLLGEDDGYNEPCVVLGYNASIPEYVKYKNGYERIYVKSYKGGKDVEPIAVGDSVFEKSYDEATFETSYTANGKTVDAIDSSMFTYGNNNTYDVPMTITVDGKEYSFAGYNITFQTRHILKNGTSNYLIFNPGGNDSGINGNGRWSQSHLKTWMNSFSTETMSNNGMDLVSLPRKFKDEEGFLKNVCGVVNRSWVFNSDDSRVGDDYGLDLNGYNSTISFESTVDKFWLLGNGNINCNGLDFNDSTSLNPNDHDFSSCQGYCLVDMKYDTSVFRGVYPTEYGIWGSSGAPHEQWTKPTMSLGSDGVITDNSPNTWWLRSAGARNCDGDSCVGCVRDDDGYCVGRLQSKSTIGVSPAFTIG